MKYAKRIFVSGFSILALSSFTTPDIQANGNYGKQQPTQQANQSSQASQNKSFRAIHNPTGEKYTTIAHRGASGYAPEHTFAAYDKSHNEMGASYIELDLQMTKDGHLVVMHDETLDRTTNGTGRVDEHTLKEIKELDAGSKFNANNPQYADPAYEGQKVPTLDEVLERYGSSANYYIETKSPDVYPGMEEKLLASLDKHHLLTQQSLSNGHVLIQSFSQASLQKVQAQNANIPLIRLLDKGELPNLTQADLDTIRSYAIGVGPEYTDLTKDNVKNLKKAGLLVHPFTVNTKADMERLNKYGVNGVFTNYPDVYEHVIAND